MPTRIAALWTRGVVVSAIALATLAAGAAEPALAGALDGASKARPVLIGVTIGARFYPEELKLGNDFAFGGRVGLGLSPRWAILLDFVASHTYRETTSRVAYVDALRALGRFNLLTGRFRPYVEAGGGGLLFLLTDTPTTAGAAVTFGVGADYRLAPQTYFYVESSADLYSQSDLVYDYGDYVYSGHERWHTLGTVACGIGVEF